MEKKKQTASLVNLLVVGVFLGGIYELMIHILFSGYFGGLTRKS